MPANQARRETPRMTDTTPRLIKKYPNRRLYDTHTSSHLTLADIRQLVVDKIAFQVVDAKSGEDLTRSILLQVILEAESGGEPIFTSEMLMGIIQFYGPYQGVLGSYLDKSIQTVIDIQSQTGAQSSEAWSDLHAPTGAGDAGPDAPICRSVEGAVSQHPEPVWHVWR